MDVRPLGWKPPEKLKELKRKHAQDRMDLPGDFHGLLFLADGRASWS